MWKLVLTAVCILGFFHTAVCEKQDVPPLQSVEIDDDDFVDATNTRELRNNFASIVRCGMDLSEPINVDHIKSSLIGFKYTLDDVTLKNMSKCALKSSSINLDSKDISIYLDCPLLTMLAKYNVSGILIAIPLEGQGDVSLVLRDLTECKQNDMACVEKNANTLYQMIMAGDPERHVEPHEPLHHELIEGNLSILKYKFFNSTFVGMNTCKISNLNWNFQASVIRFDMTCGNITMTGKYEIDGRLIILPIKGQGDYKIDTHGYKISAECEIDEIDGSDGNKHLHIHTYRLKETPTAPIVFALDNLFNGQKEM